MKHHPALQTWLQDTILNRHATLANEGRIQALRHILELATPTRSGLIAVADHARREADRHYMRADLVNHQIWAGAADTFAEVAGILAWPA